MAKFNLTNFFSDTLQKFGTKNNPKAAQLKSGGAKAKFGANPNKLFKKYMVLTDLNTVNDLAGKTGNLATWNSGNISAATYSSSTVMINAQQPKYIALGQSNQG